MRKGEGFGVLRRKEKIGSGCLGGWEMDGRKMYCDPLDIGARS